MLKVKPDVKKPLSCNQKWDDMLKTDGGRICFGCGKLVTDFRNSTWTDIAKAHSSTPIPVCGIYSKAQINSWGHEVSSHQLSCSNLVTISATLLALTQLPQTKLQAKTTVKLEQTHAINQTSKQPSTTSKPKQKFVSGTVVILQADSSKLPFKGISIYILQDSLNLKTSTDSVGRFEINITNSFNKLPNTITLFLSHPDFMTKSVILNKNNLKVLDITFSQVMIEGKIVPLVNHGTAFYIEESKEHIKQSEKKWWQFWKSKTK